MGFTQAIFLFAFFPISIIIYLAAYRLSRKNLSVCNAVLVCEGLLFYWLVEPRLFAFFVSLTILMHLFGTGIYKAESDDEKSLLMTLGITMFILIPVIYKYLPSMNITTADGQPVTMPLFSAMLVPVGIAFFILSAISYILDIYSEKAMPGSLMDSFVFAMLFPKAVCGPVVMWRDLSSQLHERSTDSDKLYNGLKRIVIGYAKKAVLADTFAAQISIISGKITTDSVDSVTVWLLWLLYFFRIYYDFSGYSDIAIGLCKVFGFEIGENFDKPYLSVSVTDFWRKWHISLGRWFREYIYIPLGGSRTGNVYFNIMITFIIAALWHGWRLNLLIWGIINGLLVVADKALSRKTWYEKMPKLVRIIITALIIYFGWMLFGAADMTDAGKIFMALASSSGGAVPNFTWKFFMTKRIIVFLVLAFAGALGAISKLNGLLQSRLSANVYDMLEKFILLVIFAADIIFVLGSAYTPFVYSLIP